MKRSARPRTQNHTSGVRFDEGYPAGPCRRCLNQAFEYLVHVAFIDWTDLAVRQACIDQAVVQVHELGDLPAKLRWNGCRPPGQTRLDLCSGGSLGWHVEDADVCKINAKRLSARWRTPKRRSGG